MKPKILLTAVLFLSIMFTGMQAQSAGQEISTSKSIALISSAQMAGVANNWQQEFNEANTGIEILFSQTEANAVLSAVNGENSMALVNESELSDQDAGLWKMVVGRSIVIPVVANNNPGIGEYMQQGVTESALQKMLASEDRLVKCFYVADETTSTMLSKFAGKAITETAAIAVPDIQALIQKLKQNPQSTGFATLNSFVDEQTGVWMSGISPLPIDYNANGKLEKIEDIFATPSQLSRGAWIGKYPKALVQCAYVVAGSSELSSLQQEFVRWAITKGQSGIESAGLSTLVQSELAGKLSKLEPVVVAPELPAKGFPVSPYLIVLAGIIVLAVVVFEVVLQRSKKRRAMNLAGAATSRAFNAGTVKVPGGLFFDRSHTWAFREKDGSVRVGLDDFLQKLTGPLTRVLLKDEGETVVKGEPMFTLVQDGKQIVVAAPVSGIIKSLNTELITDAAMINSSPYDEGWIYMVEPSNWSRESVFLRAADTYSEWLNKEFVRLKDFLAKATANASLESHVVLQDGGDVLEHALKSMSPEIWEDFQTNFLDMSN